MPSEFSDSAKSKIKNLMEVYPDNRSALMNALHITQKEFSHLSFDALQALSDLMDIPVQQIEDTASFYTMYLKESMGKNIIWVCHTLPCALRGSATVLDYLKSKLEVEVGETTKDKRFTLMKAECLASCDTAPMMQINDEYYENLNDEKIDKILGRFE